MEVKDGYKMTEVGVIPGDWEVTYLPDVAQIIHGKAHEQYIEEFGKFKVVNSKFISTDGEIVKRSGNNFQPAKRGDVLTVLSDLPNGKALAKTYHVEEDELYAVNQRICIYRPVDVDSGYLNYILNRNEYFLKFDDGVTQTHILNHHIYKCQIPLPPTKTEQRRIAAALGDVDGWIRSLEALLTKKRLVKAGVSGELLRPGVGWREVRLGEILTIRHGKSQKEVIEQDGAYPVLASGGIIGHASAFLYDRPSVLIGRKGTIDRPRFINEPFWTVDTLFYSEIFDSVDPKFIYYLFNLIPWYDYNEASGVPSLNARTIENIEVSIPETLTHQIQIAQTLSTLDAELSVLEAKLAKARVLKAGMMGDLLTGRVRLV